jgi:uncharacterized membrane protein
VPLASYDLGIPRSGSRRFGARISPSVFARFVAAPRREDQIVSVREGNGGGTATGDPNGASGIPGSPESGVKRPFGVVVGSAVGGFRTLLRQHVELAKLESTEAASIRAQGAGMMAAAAVLALFGLGFGAAAGAAGLALVMPTWAAILIVAAVFIVVAGVLVLLGRGAMRKAPAVERTRETLKEDVRWARQQIAR